MSKLKHAALAAAIGLVGAGAAPAAAPATPAQVAISRCNGQTIDDASAHVREYDRHAPGDSLAELLQRYGAITEVLSTLGEEKDVLNTVCSSDAERDAFFAQIAAVTAWALVLEADVAARLSANCAAAAEGLPTMMLADAWLTLANYINQNGGSVPTDFNEVIPKIQTRAQAVKLTLPVWADTSQYWRDQVHAKEKAAIATCPSPSPSPTTLHTVKALFTAS
jgi:hypothetical protein